MHNISSGDSQRLERFRDLLLGLSRFQVSVVSILKESYLFSFRCLGSGELQRLNDLVHCCLGQES